MDFFKVEKENSHDLGFAHACCLSGAITRDEFKSWVYWVIEHSNQELPGFFFDLIDLPDISRSFYDAVGFVPSTGLNDEEAVALDGIAYMRGANDEVDYDVHIGREDALATLRSNPQVIVRFRETFPFVGFPDSVL